MKTKFILGSCIMLAMSFFSCSQDDNLNNTEGGPDTEYLEKNGFKPLCQMEMQSTLGELDGSSENADITTRTPDAVNEEGRPTGRYQLNYVGLLSTEPNNQPTSSDIGKIIDLGYTTAKYVKHNLSGGRYNLYYKVDVTKDNSSANATNEGTITLSTGSPESEVTYKLTVFDLDKVYAATEDSPIKLNDFAYDVNPSPRGTTLRYLTFDPNLLNNNSVYLPEIADTDLTSLLADPDYAVSEKLFNECGDQYFLGPEMIIAASNTDVFIFETVPVENTLGGYYKKRTYPMSEGWTERDAVEMSRLTTVVNASFMLIDQQVWNENSYFTPGDLATSLDSYNEKYGVDLSNMMCPYATIDGINTRYEITNTASKNTFDPGRLVLWANGLTTMSPMGNEYEKTGLLSADISFKLSEQQARGLGIEGNSYSVVFKGEQACTANQMICFYLTIDGTRIKIEAIIGKTGIAFDQNTAHHITVMVNAEDFANYIKGLRQAPANIIQTKNTASGGYSVFRVPADCVVVN